MAKRSIFARRREHDRPRRVIAVAGLLALLLAAALALFFITQKYPPGNGPESPLPTEPAAVSNSTPAPEPVTALVLVAPDTDNPYLPQLLELYETYPELRPIIEDIDGYPEAALAAVCGNPETIGFFLDYLRYAPRDGADDSIDTSAEMAEGGMPLFIQWDRRWGYNAYGGGIIGISGDGPASLAMVAAGLTGDAAINPLTAACFSEDNRYCTDAGTSWTLMSEGAKSFGLIPKELPLVENTILAALKAGKPVIVSMGPGDFTASGHFVVLTGVAADGKITVNDSNSRLRSSMTWDLSVFMSQAKNLWSFELEGDHQ